MSYLAFGTYFYFRISHIGDNFKIKFVWTSYDFSILVGYFFISAQKLTITEGLFTEYKNEGLHCFFLSGENSGRRKSAVPGRGCLSPPLLLQKVHQLFPKPGHRNYRLRLQVPELPRLWPSRWPLQLGQRDRLCSFDQEEGVKNKDDNERSSLILSCFLTVERTLLKMREEVKVYGFQNTTFRCTYNYCSMFCVPYTYRRVDWHFKFYLYFWYSKNKFYVVRGIFTATNTVASIPSHILDAVEALVEEPIFVRKWYCYGFDNYSDSDFKNFSLRLFAIKIR